MKLHQINGVFFIILCIGIRFVYICGDDVVNCPLKCSCTKPTAYVKPYIGRIKAKCGGSDSLITNIDELNLSLLKNTSEITNLDLSGNNLTYLPSNAFNLQSLQKLDLNKNSIEHIDDGAFLGLFSLKRLDLSNNKIRFLTKAMFDGLMNLERLKLSQNLISQIKEGTFDGLDILKQLDVSGNPLACDCGLLWLSGWSVKLAPAPKCASPLSLKGQPLRKLRTSCTHDPAFPPLELVPQNDQVVFAGDPLRLDCRAGYALPGPTLHESTITWYWAGLLPQAVFTSVSIENKIPSETGFLESSVIISELSEKHTGEWHCELVTTDGNHTSTLSVVVISEGTKYCQPSVTKNNKGEYNWPKTVGGHVVELPCRTEIGVGVARRNCSLTGVWLPTNTSVCPYVSETTRILQQYARINVTAGRGSVVESARRLHNYTLENRAQLNDTMDAVFITQTLVNYLQFVDKEKELGLLLLDLVSESMGLGREILSSAQAEDGSCSKLVNAVETVTRATLSLPSDRWRMAVERFKVSRDSFSGITCTWWNTKERRPADRISHCSNANQSTVLGTHGKVVEASIQIPGSLLQQVEAWAPGGTHLLMLALYDNANLFPAPFNTTAGAPVVATKILGLETESMELSEPVIVTLGGGEGRLSPVWWDPEAVQWVRGPCQPSHILSDLLVLHCRRLGYFTLLSRPSLKPRIEQEESKASPPGVYIGSFVGGTCLLVAGFTYALCHAAIQTSARLKHSLANTWLSMALIAILFSVGMYQTEDVRICRGIGLFIHYLTLCVLFWMAVSINGLHRGVRRGGVAAVVVVGSEDGGGPGAGSSSSALGLYLLGWGVPALLVGLSGAVNPSGYATPSYCFLPPGPAFTPVLVPVTAVLIFVLTRAIMVRSAASEKDSNAQLSEGTQATDLELLETGGGGERGSVHSVATPSSHVDDPEHCPAVQLRAFLIVLALYLASWTTAALSVLTPLGLPYERMMFSIAYSVHVIILGAFVVFFYCFSRSDVRSVWFSLRPLVRSRNVTDCHSVPPPLVSSRNSITSGSLKEARPEPQGETARKLNLVDLHRRQYHSVIDPPDSFYNPHQSVVARKFFKRQRRKRSGTLGPVRRCPGDGATPVSPADTSELFRPRCSEGPLERLVIGAESVSDPPPPVPALPTDKYYASVASECCSCIVSEVHSTTDCTRDLTSEHSSRSSHLYATVAPDLSPALCRKPRLTIDPKNEAVRIKMAEVDKQNSDEDKKETSV